ncbi:MAG: hypothetical protein M3M97_00820 [Actinomycetota bacterium]|nr:hypothetical protein [Actinomycetota bacterium]
MANEPDVQRVLDLLSSRDPNLVSEPGREGDIGLGDPFSFPFQTIESILPLEDGRLLLLNDNNYPLSAGRNPDEPADTEAIVLRADVLSGTGGPPLPILSSLALPGMCILGNATYLGDRCIRGSG